MITKQIENEIGEFLLSADGIIYVTPVKDSKVDKKTAERVVEIVHELQNGTPHPMLIDNRNLSSIDRAARRIFADDNNNLNTTAVAILINTPLSITVVNFFIKLNNLSKPVKVFKSQQEAATWLKSFK